MSFAKDPHRTLPLPVPRGDARSFTGRIREIAEVLSGHSGVQAIFLFGSHATGKARPDSDVDIGVVPAVGASPGLRLELLILLAGAGHDHVDLVLLDTAVLVVRFEVIRHNKLLWAAPDFDRGSFVSRVTREYLDFEPVLQRQREALRRRMEGARHGSV